MSDCTNIPYFEDDLPCYDNHKPCDDHIKCCPDVDCAPLKPNCKPECCEGLPPAIPDLSNAYAVPTLVNRIFDCIKLENPNFAIAEKEFKIISNPPPNTSYNKGDKICIDRVCVKYDVIGPLFNINGTIFDNPIFTICSNKVTPQALPGSSIIYPGNNPQNFISNHLIFSINNPSCCYEHHHVKEGRQCKVVEQNVTFRILGLKIIVTGRCGCLPFTAEYAPAATTSTSLNTLLGLPDSYNFFGKLCIPKSNSGITIRENFDTCLSIDCVEPTVDLDILTNTDADGVTTKEIKFKANIESSLLIKKTIFALAEEKLSVLAIKTPPSHKCHKSEIDDPCHPCSYDME